MEFYLAISLFAVIVFVHSATLYPSEPLVDNLYNKEEIRMLEQDNDKENLPAWDRQDPSKLEEAEYQELYAKESTMNEYWLFTRSNREKPDILTDQDKDSVLKSNYKRGRELYVIVHGWRCDGSQKFATLITNALLDTKNANIIVLDWRKVSHWPYIRCSTAVPSVGEYLGKFVLWLLQLVQDSPKQVHLMGHSLGAHIVGIAGRVGKEKFGRVTGLDHAGPLWLYNPRALNTSSGIYVETINTDGTVAGIFYPLGHANFYPNGGKHPQQKCTTHSCSHSKSYEYMVITIKSNNKIGKKCINLQEAKSKTCNGTEFLMGNSDVTKNGSGLYGLVITEEITREVTAKP